MSAPFTWPCIQPNCSHSVALGSGGALQATIAASGLDAAIACKLCTLPSRSQWSTCVTGPDCAQLILDYIVFLFTYNILHLLFYYSLWVFVWGLCWKHLDVVDLLGLSDRPWIHLLKCRVGRDIFTHFYTQSGFVRIRLFTWVVYSRIP